MTNERFVGYHSSGEEVYMGLELYDDAYRPSWKKGRSGIAYEVLVERNNVYVFVSCSRWLYQKNFQELWDELKKEAEILNA